MTEGRDDAQLGERGVPLLGVQLSDPMDDCPVVVHEACWTTVTDAAYNATVLPPAAHAAGVQAKIAVASGSSTPVLRPDAEYLIEVVAEDKVTGADGNGNTATKATEQTHVVGFRTQGPVGHSQAGEQTLGPYLDRPRCYPDAAGDLVRAKPVYRRAPTLVLAFNQPYVERMFTPWRELGPGLPEIDARLDVEIVDPGDGPATDFSTPPATSSPSSTPMLMGVVAFVDDPRPVVGLATQRFSAMVAHAPDCAGTLTPPAPTSKLAQAELPELRPDVLHTAIWRGSHDGVSATVLQYPFRTSRYLDLEEHVGDHLRTEPSDDTSPARAIPILAGPTVQQASLADAMARIDDGGDHAYAFDRVVDGVLQLVGLPAVGGTEFLAVHDGTDVRALLVRSREPISDPRLDEPTLATSVHAPGLTTVASADGARYVLAPADGSAIPPGDHEVTFASTVSGPDGPVVGGTVKVTVSIVSPGA